MRRVLSLLLFSIIIWGSAAGAARADESLLGLLTRVEGEVVLEMPSPDGVLAGAMLVARSLQVMQPGTQVHVPEGARVAVVCSSDHAVRLTGPTSWLLLGRECAERGKALPAGSFRSLQPVEASLRRFDGAFVAPMATRGDEAAIPVTVLSPRGRYAGGTPERITWLDRQGFDAFEIRYEGREPATWTVSAQEAHCAPAPGEWPVAAADAGSLRLCRTDHPIPALAPGGAGKVRIHGRLPGKRPFETEYGEASWERLEERLDAEVVAWRLQLVLAGLDPVSARWIDAAHSRRRRLSGDATATLRELWRVRPEPQVALLLGDLHLAGGLGELGRAFFHAAAAGDDELLRNAARERLAALEDVQAAGGAP